MTRNPNRSSSFGFVIILVVFLIFAVALVARAQVSTSTSSINIIEYRLPQLEGNPWTLTAGPDGAIWYTVSCAGTCTPPVYDAIGRITTEGAITEYPLPGPPFGRGPNGITTGPDGALWFTELRGNLIGRISTAGEITEYPLLTTNAGPYEITAGSDGALWFTEGQVGKIGRITTAGGVSEYPVKGACCLTDPSEIVAGPDGALWFTNINSNWIGRISIQGDITNYPIPTTCSPDGITAGPDKALWFACFAGGTIGRITTGGIITTFNIPTKDSGPIRITLGSDGALWFTEQNSKQIGRLTTDGHFTEYPAGVVSPIAIATGPDCDVWFGMLRFIAKVVPPATTTTLVSSLNPSFVGQSVTFKATVSSIAGVATDGEPILFKNGSTVLGTAPLRGGTASFTTSSLLAGTFTITASYAGDSSFGSSTSIGLRQVVKSTTKFITSTALVSSLNPSLYGQPVMWAAQVATSGSVAPTGNVVFRWSRDSQTYNIGTAPLNANGVAMLTRSNLNADPFGTPYPLVAAYSGDSFNLGSTSPILLQDVLQTKTAASIASSVNPSKPGQAVTFTAKITSPTVIVTGPVTFSIGYTSLGTAQLSGGTAKFTTTSLPAGASRVKVTYYGNSNVAKSSATVLQTVQ